MNRMNNLRECKPALKRSASARRMPSEGCIIALTTLMAFLFTLFGDAFDALYPVGHAQQAAVSVVHQQRPRRVAAPQGDVPSREQPAPPAATSSGSIGEEVDDGDVVRFDTQLVTVPLVVTNREGRPVPGLRAENFAVFEDSRPQRVANFAATETPFEVALLLDTSGSTRTEVALIRRAANAFIDALRPGDRVAVVAFSTGQETEGELATVEVKTSLTSDRAALRTAVENIGSSNGTPFYNALERVATEVFRQPPRAEVRGRRALVALTDGVDSTSDADYADARARLLQAGVLCYFVQVNTEDYVEDRLMKSCAEDGTMHLSRMQLQRYRRLFASSTDASEYLNFCRIGQLERMQISRTLYNLARREMNDLARASGGKTFAAADLRSARAAFAQVAAEIGTQYSLGYYPTDKTRDGRFRPIRVEVRNLPGAQVRAREGRYAPKA